MRVTDRQTDRIFIARPRLHSMQRDKNLERSFFLLSQSTRLTDRRTDRQTEFSSLDRVCIPCSAVKMPPCFV